MKYECEMTMTIRFFVEAENEDQAQEYINTHSIQEVIAAYDKEGEYPSECYEDTIIGETNDYEFAISAKE